MIKAENIFLCLLWTALVLVGPVSCKGKSRSGIIHNDDTKTNTGSDSETAVDAIDNEVADQPVLVAGTHLADYNNARLRCDYKTKTIDTYRTLCYVTVREADGVELKAVKIADNVEFLWQEPDLLRGTALFSNCEVANSSLSYQCDVTVSDVKNLVEVKMELQIKDPHHLPRSESATLVLPFAVGIAAGFVPAIPFVYQGQSQENQVMTLDGTGTQEKELLGFQQFSFAANVVDFSEVAAMCVIEDEVYFAYDVSIFVVRDGRIRLYAGSSNKANILNFSHRLRSYLGRIDSLACTKSNVYAAAGDLNRIYKISQSGVIDVIAGDLNTITSGKQRMIHSPKGLVVTAENEVIFAERLIPRVTMIAADGSFKPIAGTGEYAYSGDGQKAVSAAFMLPYDIALGNDGSIYVADLDAHVVRQIKPDGIIVTAAGSGIPRYKDMLNTKALAEPRSLAIGRDGVLYIGEWYRGAKMLGDDGLLTQVVSAGPEIAQSIFELKASAASSIHPLLNGRAPFNALAIDKVGTTYSDSSAGIFKYMRGSASVLVGSEDASPGCEKMPIAAHKTRFIKPSAIAYANSGRLVVADWMSVTADAMVIREVYEHDGGSASQFLHGCAGDPFLKKIDSPLTYNEFLAKNSMALNAIGGLVMSKDGSLYLTNRSQNRVLKITADGKVSSFAGNGKSESTGDNGPAYLAGIYKPASLALASDGSVYLMELIPASLGTRIRKIAPDGIISTVAGGDWLASDTYGSNGNDETALTAKISGMGLAVAGNGNLFITDTENNKIRMIDKSGIIHTIAGNNDPGAREDEIDALKVKLDLPMSIAVTNDGVVYFVNYGTAQVKELKQEVNGSWTIATFMGIKSNSDCGTGRYSGKTMAANVDGAIRNSLSVICEGQPLAVVVRDTCPAANGEIRIAISQSFKEYANVVEVIKPCRK